MNLQDLAQHLTAVALAAVDPERLAREELSRRGERFGSVVALGKAGAAFARGAGSGLETGAWRLLIRPHRSPGLLDPGWEQKTGGHPVPDRQSVAAGERLERWLGEIPPRPLLALVSGGASACLELPAPELTLEDLVTTQQALLASGLPIQAVNAVRKHLSRLKGGGALRATGGRLPRILALLLSDVPGDDPSAIASGPFAADLTTFADALEALRGLEVPESVRRYLEAGVRGEIPETLKPCDPVLERVETLLVGGAGTAVAAAVAEARRQGFQAEEGGLEGEAVEAGRSLVERGRALAALRGGTGFALVLGGETTVTLGRITLGQSPGSGGRNLEVALAAARELAGGEGELVFTVATDGEDGPTRYAGAVVTGATWEAVRRAGIDPAAALARHDSRIALAAVPGALVETGPTGTNVGDLAVYLRAPSAGPPVSGMG
ncbi:MAG: glycerate 2-kinase [Acidobacteriota bacterium]|jgi:glycerate-2-kinase|nr:glycerate 2-kinase [Acidobacteriota bacterium]